MYFKRAAYDTYGNPYPRTTNPTWHALKLREDLTYTAKCGYSHKFMLENPVTRTGKPANVCKKCEPISIIKELPDDPPF